MSKLDTSGSFQSFSLQAGEKELTIPRDSIRVRPNGIEFRCSKPIPAWKEMTVAFQSPGERTPIRCTGVVVACTGNRHSGYAVSMVFLNLSRQSQERMDLLAFSQLA